MANSTTNSESADDQKDNDSIDTMTVELQSTDIDDESQEEEFPEKDKTSPQEQLTSPSSTSTPTKPANNLTPGSTNTPASKKSRAIPIAVVKECLKDDELHQKGEAHSIHSHMYKIKILNENKTKFISSKHYICEYCKDPIPNANLPIHKGWNCKNWLYPDFQLYINRSEILDYYANNPGKLRSIDYPEVVDKVGEYYYCLIDAREIPEKERVKELDFKYAKYIFYVGRGTKDRPDQHFEEGRINGNDNGEKAKQTRIKNIWESNNPVIRCRIGPFGEDYSARMERRLLELLGHVQLTNINGSQAELPEGWDFQEMFKLAVYGIRELFKAVGPEKRAIKKMIAVTGTN